MEVGGVIDEHHTLYPVIKAWEISEKALLEYGLPPDHAEKVSKAIFARLAAHDPPILPCTPEQMRDED
jgi:hypothetical protein